MYAVVRTGGKQYRVSKGEKLKVVKGASVKAKVLRHGLADKVVTFKMRRRKNSKRTRGHRQGYTEIEVTGIAGA